MPIPSSLRAVAVAGAGLAALTGATAAWAWGATGHRLIGQAAMIALPGELPAFLRSTDAAQAVGEYAREPDRSRGAGQPHDHDLDPGHFVDLDDSGRVLGGPALAALPQDREAYDAALRTIGSDSFKAGYLPYSIEDGFEQVVEDFAYWRVETAALKTDPNRQERVWIAADLQRREALTLRDIGYWAHFVGDGSQPLHVSVHYNGWGAYPNPEHFTDEKIHGPFEGPFVQAHVTLPAVEAAMGPVKTCLPIARCTAAYLGETSSYVTPLYRSWGAGDYARADAQAVRFTTERVAAGAAELRDLIVSAWRASGDASIGYKPSITVQAAEAGQSEPFAALYGDD